MSVLVRHAMTEAPQSAGPDSTAQDAAALMRSLDVGVVPVMDGDRLIGLVTDRDLVLRVVAEGLDAATARLGDIATPSPVTITPDTQLAAARDLMARHQIRRLPVTKAGLLVGILSLGDVAEADSSMRSVGETLAAVSEDESTLPDDGSGPARGTPKRVMEAREEGSGSDR